jgi:P pilus assembly chaperone PapD
VKSLPVALLLTWLGAAPLLAQGVLVAPTSIFIDGRSRSATVLLVNPNDDPAEVELSVTYGYTLTDSAGSFTLWTSDAPDSTAPSAAAWIRIFPRRVAIEPRAQQLVRLLVSPPAGLPDGEYWARLVVLARGGKLAVEAATDSGSVSVGLAVEVRTILPVLYRNGDIRPGAALQALAAARSGDSLAVRARLSRTGSAAALGTFRAVLLDSTGTALRRSELPVSVYAPIEPRLALPVDSLPPGRYSVRMELVAERPDLPPEALLRFPAVHDSLPVTLP